MSLPGNVMGLISFLKHDASIYEVPNLEVRNWLLTSEFDIERGIRFIIAAILSFRNGILDGGYR